MGRYLLTALIACFMVIPASAAAGGAEKTSPTQGPFGTFIVQPGAWSEYVIRDKSTGKQGYMRMAIVGAEGDGYWYEVDNREGDKRNVFKMLVTGNPNEPGNIQRFIVKLGTNSALEMDRDLVSLGRRMTGNMLQLKSGMPTDASGGLQDAKTGEGVVTVPAGTFAVDMHRVGDAAGKIYGEYTYSRTVVPFGIVTAESVTRSMVLQARGAGATSSITEEPARMALPPGMMPDRPQPQGLGPGPGTNVRQLPGMGTGYEPRP
ncbi:MAG: hypothetical protein ACWGN1_05885 [Desulfobulbales bacterium]